MDILNINAGGAIAPAVIIDSLNIENELPNILDDKTPEPESMPTANAAEGVGAGAGIAPAPNMPVMSLKVAYESAQQYTSLFNMLLGIVGSFIGGGHESRYKLNDTESQSFAKSLGEMMHYNQWSALNPNIMFLLTTIIIVAPKARNMYTDRKAKAEAEDAKAAAAHAAAVAKYATANNAAKADKPDTKGELKGEPKGEPKGDELSAGAAKDLENLVATYEMPESAAVALTIPEIGLSRPNFKLAEKSITPNVMKIYYAYDVQNARIKKGKHEEAVNGNPSPYFEKFILSCESLGLGERGQEIACKAMKERIRKHYNITAEQVNAQRAKLLK